MKSTFKLFLFIIFVFSSLLLADNSNYFQTKESNKDKVYGVFSDHYSAGLKVVDDTETTLTDEDDGRLWLWGGIGSSWENISESSEPFEGENVVGVKGGVEGYAGATFAFCDTKKDSDTEPSIENGKVKDLSAYPYIMFMKLTTATTTSITSAVVYDEFRFQSSSDTLKSYRGPTVNIRNMSSGIMKTTDYINAQNNQYNWNNIVTTFDKYADIDTNYQYSASSATAFHFYIENIHSHPAYFLLDNVVVFKYFPTKIITSTTGISVPVDAALLIGAEATDASDNLSAMPPPVWENATRYKKTYNALFKKSSVGSYNVNVSTGIYEPESEEYRTISGAMTVNVVDDTSIWKSKVCLFNDNILTKDIEVSKLSIDDSIVISTTSAVHKIGTRSLKIDYEVVASSEHWAGIYVTSYNVDETARTLDLSGLYENANSILSFWIKAEEATFDNIEIGIEGKGAKAAKVKLSDLGYTYSSDFQQIKIPLHNFKILNRDIDLSEIDVYFVCNVLGSSSTAQTGTFYLDDIQYLSTNDLANDNIFNIVIADTSTINGFTWTVSSSTLNGWVVANEYAVIDWENYDYLDQYIKIYTDNANIYSGDLDPAGLVKYSTSTTTVAPLKMAWLVREDAISAHKNNLKVYETYNYETGEVYLSTTTSTQYYPWHYILDEKNITGSNISAATLLNTSKGLHTATGDENYSGTPNKIYLYLAADFKDAITDAKYTTNLKIEKKQVS